MVVHQQRREETFPEVAGLNELIHSRSNPKLFPPARRCALVIGDGASFRGSTRFE